MRATILGIALLALIAVCAAQSQSTVRCYSCHNAPIQGYVTPGVATADCGETMITNSTAVGSAQGVMCMRIKYDDGTGNLRFARTPADVCVELMVEGSTSTAVITTIVRQA